MKTERQLSIQVPATTANLGPGFDTLGVALQLHNFFRLTLNADNTVALMSEKGQDKQDGALKLVKSAADLFYKFSKVRRRGFLLEITSDVPIARGLGSSSTLIVAVLAGLNKLHGKPLKKKDLVTLAAGIEGHPDNVAPAILGGFVAASLREGQVHFLQSPLPRRLKFVLLVPPFEIETRKARSILPDLYDRGDVVNNISQTSLLTGAFLTGEYELLAHCLQDRIHQPYRAQLLPPLFDVIEAGKKAGALGGWLSGSGSTICCVTLQQSAKVALAMLRTFNKTHPGGQVKILAADNEGVQFS
ncbi:MAG: homoserine kinase [Verrucomicrobiae bacterium]|nr:homoserine kinase [Verrucomicrobiae bacterium]